MLSGSHFLVVLKDLVETALKINAPGFGKYHIAITRDYVDLPQVITDKQQVRQIVANLELSSWFLSLFNVSPGRNCRFGPSC